MSFQADQIILNTWQEYVFRGITRIGAYLRLLEGDDRVKNLALRTSGASWTLPARISYFCKHNGVNLRFSCSKKQAMICFLHQQSTLVLASLRRALSV